MHRDAPRITCPRLIKPNQPTPTQRGTKLASRMHCQNSSCPPHARSTSTLADVHGLQARFCGKRASTRLERYTYGTDEGERTWPSHTTYDLQMPITLATADNSPLASQAMRRLRVVCWMNTRNQSETRAPQRFCSSAS